jgi:4-hydroxy-4-methyl-2-oxoglutarate aldolase
MATAPRSERLRGLSTALVGDVLDELGYSNQILASEIRAIVPGLKLAGPAFCVSGARDGGSSQGSERDSQPQPGFELFRHMYEGCIAVVATEDYDVAGPWGENTALSARVRGCRGAVIDGGTRDVEELARMSFPIFARFATAARVEGRWRHVEFETPVRVRGQLESHVVVSPGDFVLGDGDGVVVVPSALVDVVLDAAEELHRIEVSMREELADGVDREDVYRGHDRYAHVRRLRSSLAPPPQSS